jgi:orotate phosphoribosyltransferase-like protein
VELHKAGFSLRKIESKTNLPKSTIHYLVKQAKRNRVKYKGMTDLSINVIFLEHINIINNNQLTEK